MRHILEMHGSEPADRTTIHPRIELSVADWNPLIL